jgi:cation diffusion facilitator CzcD-associated flavoprotein CzcO
VGSNPTPSAPSGPHELIEADRLVSARVTLQAPETARTASANSEHVDVLIVGAGISGIGAAHHLLDQSPERSFVVLERKHDFGGTWVTHRYPGIRSDSDLYTFGYRFKPWTGAPIATGDEILSYLGEVVEDDKLETYVRFGHTVTAASWSSADARWSITAVRDDTGAQVNFTAGFLWMCQGYYRHEKGYTPTWEAMDTYQGTVVHPQEWPEDLDLTDKRVVVIGSGATAATLIPNIAEQCAHVTMVQRSPTFFITGRNVNEVADLLRTLEVPEEWVHEIVRRKILYDMEQLTRVALDFPDFAREELLKPLRELLGDDFDVDTHFNPRYKPWQQRIAFVPDADLFLAIKSGKVSVRTDEIATFTESGIELASGEALDADVVITATGFEVNVLGDVDFTIDGAQLDFADTVTYRGMMFTGVPNMVWVFGYFRNSWTLRVDLICDFVCRLLEHLDVLGKRTVVPVLSDGDADMERLPWVDPDNFNPGYLMRSMHLLPKQGDHQPWVHAQDYWAERKDLPDVDLDDGTLSYA